MRANKVIMTAVLALALIGCNSQKKITQSSAEKESTKTETVKKKTTQQLAIEAQPDFQTVYASKVKFAIKYQQKNVSASGSITLLKDSICIISVQPLLGIELVRLEITTKDVTLIDKLNKRYVQMTYPEIEKELGLPLSYTDVQNILMARMVVLGKPQSVLYSDAAKATSAAGKTEVKLTEGKISYAYTIDENNLALVKAVVSRQNYPGEASIDYNNYSLSNGILFPNSFNVAYAGGGIDASGTITLSSRIFNQSVSASRAGLGGYRKTTIDTILK